MRNRLLPLFVIFVVGSIAFVLIFVVVARSPYTHANLRPEGYDRTEIAFLSVEHPFEGFSLVDPRLAATGDPAQDGRVLFFQYGCAACHGLSGQGGTVGNDLDIDDISPAEFRRDVRNGPKGMPPYMEEVLSDEDVEKLYAYLESVARGASDEPAAKAY